MDVRNPGLGGVPAGEREHLVGEVEPVSGSTRADTLRGQDHVDPAARAEVEDDLAFAKVGDRRRVSAAERCERGCIGDLVPLGGAVQPFTEVGCVPLAARAVAAGRARSGTDGPRGLGITLTDLLAQ